MQYIVTIQLIIYKEYKYRNSYIHLNSKEYFNQMVPYMHENKSTKEGKI